MTSGILLIAVGLAGIIFGLVADEFYAAFIRRPAPGEKPMPKWLGRMIFCVAGLWSIYYGISDLMHR
jgi:hypothetical protein